MFVSETPYLVCSYSESFTEHGREESKQASKQAYETFQTNDCFVDPLLIFLLDGRERPLQPGRLMRPQSCTLYGVEQ
jgi:hypothetical protein